MRRSAVVVDDLDVVPVGVQDERAVVARVVDGALAGTAVVLVARGESGGVERPHGRVVLRREREMDVLRQRPLTEHVHIAFPAQDNATVQAFHAAAIAEGYADHGGPGERAIYHPGYFGAFVLDPDGHNIEVVNHNR